MKYREMIPYLFCFMFTSSYSLASMEIKSIKENKVLVYSESDKKYSAIFDCLSGWPGVHIMMNDKNIRIKDGGEDVRLIPVIYGYNPIIFAGSVKKYDESSIIISVKGKDKTKQLIKNMSETSGSFNISVITREDDNFASFPIDTNNSKEEIEKYKDMCINN